MKTPSADKNDKNIVAAIVEGWQNLDPRAIPGFLMFMLLIAAEASVNTIASIKDFGLIASMFLALFFGVFIACWHVITGRVKNSVRQQSTAESMENTTSILAVLLLLINLIRMGRNGFTFGEQVYMLPSITALTGWDVLAIIIIVIVFALHLFGYLEWHKSDTDRKQRQDYERARARVKMSEDQADIALKKAEVELLCIEAKVTKAKELHTRFSHLDPSQLNRIIREAEREIELAFEKNHNVDLNKDGVIGERANIPALPVANRVYASVSPAIDELDATESDYSPR